MGDRSVCPGVLAGFRLGAIRGGVETSGLFRSWDEVERRTKRDGWLTLGLADDDGPRATQTGDGLSVLRWHMVGQVGSTADCAHTGCLVAVLDCDGQAMQGSEVISARACRVSLNCCPSRGVRVDGDDRVERAVVRADSREIQLDQFGAGHLPGGERRELFSCRSPSEIVWGQGGHNHLFLLVKIARDSIGIPFGLPTKKHSSRPNGILQAMRVRERLTSATATLMQRHGVAGTGIAEILSSSGVTRRSIYLNFPGGKAELVAAATRSAGDELTTLLRGCIEQRDPVGAFTRVWSEILVSTDFEGGCPVVAAAFSRDEAPEAASTAADVFAKWGQLLADRLSEDGIKRSAAQSLSTTVVAALEGAVILSRAAQSTAPLEQVARHLNELISQHRPAATRDRRRRR